jgi:hypothetical protein
MKIICGIDPGLDGGIAFIEDGKPKDIYIMPTLEYGKKRIIDARRLAEILKLYTVEHVIIERVGSRPDQSAPSVFTFGYGAGLLEGVVAALGLSYSFVIPQAWMRVLFKGMPKEENKTSVVYCVQRFPGIDWRATPRSRVPHDGMTDATCIALAYLQSLDSRSTVY